MLTHSCPKNVSVCVICRGDPPRERFILAFLIFRYNGKALIDEDLLRETGVTDFTKYRGHPDHEPSRMMPRQVPSLFVDEDDLNNVLAP